MATAQDLDTLVMPAGAWAALTWPRPERIDGHGFDLSLTWWNAALTQYGVLGAPATGERDGQVVSEGVAFVSRSHLFRLAAGGRDDEAVLRLLWHALLWGSGVSTRNNRVRLASVAADVSRAAALLRVSATLAAESPERAYALLRPRGRSAIKGLGPAFFTKFLYFAGAGAVTHPSAILDARVDDALRRHCGWTPPGARGFWTASTYGSYCRLLGRWAIEASGHLGRPVGSDELERWLFDAGEGPAGRRRRLAQASGSDPTDVDAAGATAGAATGGTG